MVNVAFDDGFDVCISQKCHHRISNSFICDGPNYVCDKADISPDIISISCAHVIAVPSGVSSLVSNFQFYGNQNFIQFLHIKLKQSRKVIFDAHHNSIGFHQSKYIDQSPFVLEYSESLFDILCFDVSIFIPLVEPLHRLESLLAIYHLSSLLGIIKSWIHHILIDLCFDIIYLFILAHDQGIPGDVIYLAGVRYLLDFGDVIDIWCAHLISVYLWKTLRVIACVHQFCASSYLICISRWRLVGFALWKCCGWSRAISVIFVVLSEFLSYCFKPPFTFSTCEINFNWWSWFSSSWLTGTYFTHECLHSFLLHFFLVFRKSNINLHVYLSHFSVWLRWLALLVNLFWLGAGIFIVLSEIVLYT